MRKLLLISALLLASASAQAEPQFGPMLAAADTPAAFTRLAALHALPLERMAAVSTTEWHASMTDSYRAMAADGGARRACGAVLTRLAEPGTPPALIHCAGGRDRTGNPHDDVARRQFAGIGGDVLRAVLSGAVDEGLGARQGKRSGHG